MTDILSTKAQKTHKKALLVSASSVIFLILVMLISSWIFEMGGFNKLERRYLERNVIRAKEILYERINGLSLKLADWSRWDDSYAFVENKNDAYIQSNLTDNALSSINIDVMAFFNSRGKIVFSMYNSPDKKVRLDFPKDLKDYFSVSSQLIKHASTDSSISGLIMLADMPVMIASRPITTSNGNGPVRGAIVFAKYVDKEEFERLGKMLQLNIEILKLNKDMFHFRREASRESFINGKTILSKVPDSKTISGYTVIQDIFGNKDVVIKVSMGRDIYRFGVKAMMYFFLTVIITASIFGVLIYIPLHNEINKRQTIEERLIENKLFLEQIQKIARLAGWKANPHTDFLEWTEGVFDIVEYPKGAQPGLKEGLKFYLPEYRNKISDLIARCLKTGEGFTIECEGITGTGRILWTEVRGFVAVKDGGSSYVMGSFQDITYRKLMENALRESNERFDQLAEHGGIIAWEVDSQGLYTYISHISESLIGYRPEELIGKLHFYDIHPEKDREVFKQAALSLFSRKEPFRNFVNPIQTKEGKKIWVSTSGMPVLSPDGSLLGYKGSDINITERKWVEDSLMRANRELEIASKKANAATIAKTQFLANMSHEIRTPMNAILGFIDILQHTNLDDIQKDYVATAISSGEVLLALVNDVLDISKIEADGLHLEKIDFDLEYLVESVIKIIKPRIQAGDVEFLFEYAPEAPAFFRGDPTRIRQILINLISNAVKFTERGEIRVCVKIDETASNIDGYKTAVISVKDTGIGVPPEKQAMIFELFTQADESTTRKFGGTGLGLAISRALARKMGGDITVSSEKDKGSEFIATLRLEAVAPSTEKKISLVRAAELIGRKVAIVDDNDSVVKLTELYCKKSGMNVIYTANRAKTILDWLGNTRDLPEMILMDLMMPEMDGADLARSIRGDPRLNSVKLIAVTADVRPGAASDAQKAGFDAYLPKPIIRKELVKVIQATLGDKREEKEIVTRHIAEELSLKGVKVLVAEDKPTNQKLMKVYLDVFGCISDFANDGREAVEKMRLNNYDICLMDVQMPIMGGLEAARIIRDEIDKKIPIIAITAAALKEDRDRALSAGMNDYLMKPVDNRKMKDIILKWVNVIE